MGFIFSSIFITTVLSGVIYIEYKADWFDKREIVLVADRLPGAGERRVRSRVSNKF